MESIKKRLVPEFESRGFTAVPSTAEDKRGEIGAAFPFGRMQRRGPRGLETIEIQLDKRGGASFRLNVGLVPADGVVDAHAGHIPANRVWVQYLPESYELLQSPRLWKWFSVTRWPWKRITSAHYDKLVNDVVKLMPEIEGFFRDGKPGPHMRYVDRRSVAD